MNLITALLLLFTYVIPGNNVKISTSIIDKKEFYQVMRSGKMNDVNRELELINTSTSPEKEGYEGAMIIRKAGLVKLPTERLKLFKKGKIKLEAALQEKPDNGEYHFLRLIIQENAPKIVKYSNDLEADRQFVKKSL